MELIKWQSVVVEWVNCLNLSTPVQTISDLKNEDFFRKLLFFISPPDQNESLDRSVEDISLTDFLKKHYPAYSLEEEPTLIQDDMEICNISSLLLHYCCLIDGREELTSPLCKELSTTCQFHIKSFLEDLQESNIITRDLLIDAITNSTKYSTPTKFVKTPFDSPKQVGNTPLLDFLKTPLKKQQVYDSHKKEIKLLQAQLDLERFEKADLQEELNQQYEKHTKFDKIISNKQSEISRLRSELLALESRTPPSDTKADGRLENKRLRDEITSLEKYVEILHKEQEEIQNERDKAREKLRKVEETCNEWQSRALNSERQCSNLSEVNESQQSELFQLREKCEELSSILEELNAKNICDESYEIEHMQADFSHNRSGPIDYESLAHTVIDVQLIDAQEENKNLRKRLDELEVNTTDLSTKLNMLQTEIDKILEENKALVDSNKKLKQQILGTEKQLEKCRQTLKQTQDEKENLNTCIEDLEKKLSETEFNLSYYSNESESLDNEVKEAKEANNILTEQLHQQIKDFNHLLSEKSKLHSRLDESESENEIRKEFFEQFEKIFENCASKFETYFNEHSKLPSDNDNILKLKKLITVLETKIADDVKNFNKLQDCYNTLSGRSSILENNVKTLRKENELLKEFLDKFNKVFENCLTRFEAEIQHYSGESSTEDGDSAKDNTLSQIDNLVLILENKFQKDAENIKKIQENSNHLLTRIANLQDEVTSLYNNEIESQREKSNLKMCLEESKSKLHQLDDAIDSNNNLIIICKSTIEEKCKEISSLKNIIISKDLLIEELNKDKNNLTATLQTVENKLSEETLALDISNKKINELMISIKEVETKLQQFEEDRATFESTIVEKNNEISSLNDVLANKNKVIEGTDTNLKTVQNELLEVKRLMEVGNNELVQMKTSLQDAQSQVLEQKTCIDERSKQICELQEILDAHDKNMDLLNNEKSDLIVRLESTATILSKEKDAKEQAEIEVENLKKSLQDFGLRMQDITKTSVKHTELIDTYKSLIEENTKEFNHVVAVKDKSINALENEKVCLIQCLQTAKDNLQAEKNATGVAQAEIIKLKSSLRKVESKLQDVNDNNNKLIETYKALIEEKTTEMTNAVASKDKFIEDVNKEKCNLVITLQIVENKLSEERRSKELTEENCQKIKNDLIDRDKCIKSLETQKVNLENNIDSLNKKIVDENSTKTKLEEKCSKLQTIITEVEQQMQDLQKDKSKLNHQLETVNQNLIESQIKNKDLVKSISEKDNNLQNLEKQKQNLNIKLEKLEKELLNAEDSKQILKTKLEEMTTTLEEKSNHISNLKLEKTDLQNQVVCLERELSEKTKQKNEIQVQLQDVTESLNQKEDCIKYLETDKNAIEQQIELLNNNLSSQELELSNKITDHLKKNRELQAKIDTFNQNFSMTNIELSTIVNMFNNTEDCHMELEQIHTGDCFGDVSKTISNLKNNICSLIFEKRQLDSEISILQQQITDLEQIKLSADEEASELKKTIKSLTEECRVLQSDKDKYKSHMETYRKKLDDLELNVSSAEKLVSKHSHEMIDIQKDRSKLMDQIHDLEEEIKQHKLEKTNIASDLLSIKSEFKEIVMSYEQTLESNEDMKQKYLQLSEDKSVLALKLDQVTNDCCKLKLSLSEYSSKHSQKVQEIEDIQNSLSSREKIVQELEEKLKTKDELFTNLLQEKHNFVSQISALTTTLNHLEQIQNDSVKMNQKVQNAEKSINKINEDFNNQIEVMDKKRLDELEALTKQLTDVTSDNNKLITLCKESNNKIHSIYTIVFENKEDKQIIERFNKLQQEKQLESLNDEKEIVGKECDFIANEIIVLKKAFKELSNYETLKDKYDQLSTENNVLKSKLSEIENKLSNIQLENTKYQKQISEKEIDHKSTKSRYEEEIDLMKATCANWQKIIYENEAEFKKLQNDHQNLKEKYDTEFEVLQKSKIKLEETVSDLEKQIKLNNNVITQQESQYEDLNNKYETATQKITTLDPEMLNLQDKLNNYKKIINDLETDNIRLSKNFNDLTAQHKIFMDKCKQDHVKTDKEEVAQLRSVYSELLTENSRLQLDCTVLKKTVEDRNNQLSNLTLVKDSYEKLLEENNKINMELDTLRYKRTRDKEEYKRVLEEGNTKSNKEIQEVKSEYEEKLKKMKEKIVKLYREEVEKEKKKVCTLQQGQAEETISTLKSQLWVTGNKYVDLKKENEKLREQLLKVKDHHQLEILEMTRGSDIHGSRDSVCSLRERRPIREVEERKTSTLPRDMKASYTPHSQRIDIIEECVTISRKRRSITSVSKNLDPGLKMEDEEGEFFNNTYLADLKAGRCVVSDRDSICSSSSRLSELQFRNSLCPPHLKSSYPAETQFTSPGQCKEEDIKMGAVDLDDSMSSSLLPGEKPRTKKDWGQTLYKKPGPPTPSKNGGRLSLQGNEVHPREVLREHNPGRTTSTPSRIKALFSRSGASSRDTENVSTPRGPTKRRSIFRR